eukprot:4117358-Pleurochrysis_carterae.AAC.1
MIPIVFELRKAYFYQSMIHSFLPSRRTLNKHATLEDDHNIQGVVYAKHSDFHEPGAIRTVVMP